MCLPALHNFSLFPAFPHPSDCGNNGCVFPDCLFSPAASQYHMRPVFIFCKYVHANTLTFRIEKETMFCADLNSFNLDLQHTFQETSAVFCIHHNSCKHKIVMKYQFFQCFLLILFLHITEESYTGRLS